MPSMEGGDEAACLLSLLGALAGAQRCSAPAAPAARRWHDLEPPSLCRPAAQSAVDIDLGDFVFELTAGCISDTGDRPDVEGRGPHPAAGGAAGDAMLGWEPVLPVPLAPLPQGEAAPSTPAAGGEGIERSRTPPRPSRRPFAWNARAPEFVPTSCGWATSEGPLARRSEGCHAVQLLSERDATADRPTSSQSGRSPVPQGTYLPLDWGPPAPLSYRHSWPRRAGAYDFSMLFPGMCLRGHLLDPAKTDGNYVCDGCGNGIESHAGAFLCQPCNSATCSLCAIGPLLAPRGGTEPRSRQRPLQDQLGVIWYSAIWSVGSDRTDEDSESSDSGSSDTFVPCQGSFFNHSANIRRHFERRTI